MRKVSFFDSDAKIISIEREKSEIIHTYALERFEKLSSLYGENHKETKEAEMISKLSLKDLEIAKIRENEALRNSNL